MQRKTRFFLLAVLILSIAAICVAQWTRRQKEDAKSVFVKEAVYAENRI